MRNLREIGRDHEVLYVVVILLSIVVFNLLIIDFLILSFFFSDSSAGVLAAKTKTTSKSKITPTPTQIQYCPSSCVTQIQQAVATPVPSTAADRDQFVFLGTGNVSSNSWTNIPGAQATFNASSYGSVRKAVFEAAVQNPTTAQQVYVRLYNVTKGEVVSGSTVSFDGTNSGLLTSGTINLPSGTQTYQVQMLAYLNTAANLTLSRIHLTHN